MTPPLLTMVGEASTAGTAGGMAVFPFSGDGLLAAAAAAAAVLAGRALLLLEAPTTGGVATGGCVGGTAVLDTMVAEPGNFFPGGAGAFPVAWA